MAKIIDGKAIAAEVRSEVRDDVAKWTSDGHAPPYLAVILVGNNPASASYVRGKIKASQEVGIAGDTLKFDASISEKALLSVIQDLNDSPHVSGILVQLPLPDHLDSSRIIAALNPDKDVDGLHTVNAGRLVTGSQGFVPCTPAGIVELLLRSNIPTEGQHAVILGRSNLVGRPLASLLLRKKYNSTVTVCHSRTKNLPEICRTADILVAAIGRTHFVSADMIKPGAAIIDVGINRVEDSTRKRGYYLTGDVDYNAAKELAGYITPVPGGVGPMTIAMLLKNTMTAAKLLG
ncbi:MAG: bifunctional methylenetetrahydrofolate dehydrogenase/methenyltetrahydrofolate cyclohydrolase FolD [Rhodothermaceae bacterium]|nr:bifunctional methylenetetrahydrofolate dehydrogenase/methenyltetrahydrofolate cyclohydrolase FolD [Rhodothermaceae bacterium]MXX57808.1 bifunctional methylenetetrahydrofolate dehydrogenase/methenyltetrahydrofolate cyclohydrolase FolD [Rhodothermaceae bacterium]MYD19756.1 bifunctional methylenetetrahydrofolate dehydrogenase/methenyltetrahydrofolate cyclohydrolase FolD [Rhodothermaceae bacterium]MYD55595.1 bifunctional methylenetetrahydrofolate dehydrogenase/methenyltetrahydrofolate cyclohydrol